MAIRQSKGPLAALFTRIWPPGRANAVTPVVTATGTAGKPIKVGKDPFALAITPNGKVVEVVNQASGTVTPIFTAVNRAGKAITVGSTP